MMMRWGVFAFCCQLWNKVKNGIVVLTVLVMACFFMCSCAKEDDVTESVKRYFLRENVTFDPALESCYIIPGGGCSGCIASGLTFLRANQKEFSKWQDKNMVIFTNIVSRKMLERNLKAKSIKVAELKAVTDANNVYLVDSRYSDYPLVIYLDKGNVVSVEYQSAETNALNKYEKFLQGSGE